MTMTMKSNMSINKYNLSDFEVLSFTGFDFVIPQETIHLIATLSMEVGSPTYIKTPIFQKKDNSNNSFVASSKIAPKKKRTGKNMEITNDDWESIRSFQVTSIEHNVGVDGQIDKIRSCLNKLTDKSYLDMRGQIMEILNQLVSENTDSSEMERIGNTIFEIASNNKFYSKLYADLYSDLIKEYPVMEEIFQNNYKTYMQLFTNIEHVDAEKDYNQFCLNNKRNENRKAISSFFVNLALNGIIELQEILLISKRLMEMVLSFMTQENKKNEVDELTENIFILYNKDIIHLYKTTNQDDFETSETFQIDIKTGLRGPISSAIKVLAGTKVKTQPSLSSKSIFKFMDM